MNPNLIIINTSITIQAKETIGDHFVNYAYNYIEGQVPQSISFNVKKGPEGNPEYNGNITFSGTYYPGTRKMDFQNNNFHPDILPIYNGIYDTCLSITNDLEPAPVEEPENPA